MAERPLFVVARNPDPDSSLPYVLQLPLRPDPLVLRARDTWPRTSKIFCFRVEAWPADAEVVEELPVRSCVRRGRAIDLVLDRGREQRSQFVFAEKDGRELIFWQTPKTTKGTRPGVRIPARRASGYDVLAIVADSRERYGYRFAKQQVEVEKRALRAGDYGVDVAGELVAAVERKSVPDLAKSLIDGSLGFALAELATLQRAAVVVEGNYGDLLKLEHVKPGFVLDLLARVQVRYPSVPVVFLGTRPLAEEWTYRFLAAARAEAAGERDYPLA